jgi:chemotaxis protein CheD
LRLSWTPLAFCNHGIRSDMKNNDVALIDFYLLPGHIYLSHEPTLVSTVVGSCTAVSLWDVEKKYGGMAHFLYPLTVDRHKATAQYGNVAVKCLVMMFLESGVKEQNLRAQIFGGALSPDRDCTRIARENIQIARKILRSYHIGIISEDTGGNMGRKIVYNTHTNEAIVYKVNTLRQGDWYPYMYEGR